MKPHVVSVMRPPKAHGTLGQPQGLPEVVVQEWPCSIKSLSGRELELARSTFAAATLEVEGEGDPSKRIRETDYLQFGTRKLFVGFVDDKSQVGIGIQKLICGEER